MIPGIIVLLAIDTALALFALYAMRRSWPGVAEGVPLLWALGLSGFALACHFVGLIILGVLDYRETAITAPELTIGMSIAGGAVPGLLYAWMLLTAVANIVTGRHIEPDPISRDTLNPALACERKGEIDAAIAECKRIAKNYPRHALPLQEAARIANAAARYEEAADLYRVIMRQFKSDDEIWTAAATPLMTLLRFQLGEPESANQLQRTINARRTQQRRPGAPKNHAGGSPRQAQQVTTGDDHYALEKYKRQYREDPSNPRHLFGAASLLERQQDWDAATSMLRILMNDFADDDAVWCEAAYRLGLIFEQHIGDKKAAAKVYREVVRRRTNTEHRKLAHNRLAILESVEIPAD